MNIKIITLVALISFLLSACAGVGLSDSSDPYKKLDFSYLAMDQGRHIPSERYIKQAIKIFKEKNDKAGLAEAYFTYGLFYKYGPWQLFSGPINTDKSAGKSVV